MMHDEYLQLSIGEARFLMPAAASLAMENRDALTDADEQNSKVVAWRHADAEKWPTYCLDPNLHPNQDRSWQQAVFIDAAPRPIGLAVDDVKTLPRTELIIQPFTPIGPLLTPKGPLFNAVWVSGDMPVLIFSTENLAEYLSRLG